MNLRTGLKTMAVALPMAVAPMKSTAQNAVKEVSQKASEVIVHTMEGTKVLRGAEADAWIKNIEDRLAASEAAKAKYTPTPLYMYGKAGAGYGLEPFMNQGKAEAKGYATVGMTNNHLKFQLDAALGKSTQSYSAQVGGNVLNGGNAGLETGTVFRYTKTGHDIKGAILESDVNALATNNECGVDNYHNTVFWGAYVNPSYKFGKASVNANLEAGMVGFGGLKEGSSVSRAGIDQAIQDGRMVNRSVLTAGANFGVGADYEVAKGLKLGADVKYSTFDQHPGFNVKATYEFGKDVRKK